MKDKALRAEEIGMLARWLHHDKTCEMSDDHEDQWKKVTCEGHKPQCTCGLSNYLKKLNS